MTLRESLEADFKVSLKARETAKISTLRMIRAAVQIKEIEDRRPLDDQGIIEVLSSQAKQRRDSIQAFQQAGRTDLVEKEQAELDIILSYLPQQLTREELEQMIGSTISEVGGATLKEMGRVMKVLMPRIKGRAEGKLVNQLVREKLSQPSA